MDFGFRSQTYSAYVHLFIVKLWQRLYYGSNEEPERVGLAYATFWEKWGDFWSDAPSEVLPNLYIGSAKNAADATTLSQLNIRYIVNCTSDLPNFHETILEYNRVPLMDTPGASLLSIRDSIDFVVAKVVEKLANDEPVLIHCFMGASRSVSIGTLILMKLKNIPAVQAYGEIALKRKAAKINTSFMDDLRRWQFDEEE